MSRDPLRPYSLGRYTIEAMKSRHVHWLGASSLLGALHWKQHSKHGEKVLPSLLIEPKLDNAAYSEKQIEHKIAHTCLPC